jgi:diadenosine tetraphosphate (Ap4A) HIT family hydrolase
MQIKAHYPSTDENGHCIFCQIVSGRITTPGVFWEDEEFMAFLSLWPNTEGFSVVIPKKHYHSDILALPDDVFTRLMSSAKQVASILQKHFDDAGRVGLIAEGTGVDHAHLKLYPMHGTAHLADNQWRQHPSMIETFYPIYPGYISSNEGPRAADEEIAALSKKLALVKV